MSNFKKKERKKKCGNAVLKKLRVPTVGRFKTESVGACTTKSVSKV